MLDNTDDASVLLEAPAASGEARSVQWRMDCIPTCDHGSMMITTRSKREALRLVYESEAIDVRPMSEDEAVRLLESKLGQSDAGSRQLAVALDCMPLAITQASACIRERRPRCSVWQYREEIERSSKSRTGLLRRDVLLVSRDVEVTNSVLLTWQISFEHIYETRRSAASLLSLMNFCDRLAIPECLVRSDAESSDDAPCTEAFHGVPDFEEDIVVLCGFSFVSRTADPQSWEMHRLVQDAAQVWLEDHGRLSHVRDRFVHRLYTSFPTSGFENWSACSKLFPHAKSAMEQKPVKESAVLEWASVMYKSAWYAMEQGRCTDALAMAIASMEVSIEHLGEEDRLMLCSLTMVALTYKNQGRWDKAEELQVRVMEISRRVVGVEHPDTLTSMANLALTYRSQGRWNKAEELQVRVMETRRRVLGKEHRDTLTSMANLASTYWDQGRWDKAEELEVREMEISRRLVGEEHPDTLTSMNNLALPYSDQELWAEAEQLQTQAVAGCKKSFGLRHPHIHTVMETLACIQRMREHAVGSVSQENVPNTGLLRSEDDRIGAHEVSEQDTRRPRRRWLDKLRKRRQ